MLALDGTGRRVAAICVGDTPAALAELDRLRGRFIRDVGVVPSWLDDLVVGLRDVASMRDVAHRYSDPSGTPSGFITVKECAKAIGKHPGTVRRRAAAGMVPGAEQHSNGCWLIPVGALRKEL